MEGTVQYKKVQPYCSHPKSHWFFVAPTVKFKPLFRVNKTSYFSSPVSSSSSIFSTQVLVKYLTTYAQNTQCCLILWCYPQSRIIEDSYSFFNKVHPPLKTSLAFLQKAMNPSVIFCHNFFSVPQPCGQKFTFITSVSQHPAQT